MKKSFIMALALVLVLGIAIGGTVAWLTATSDTVVNTFTVGDIDIKLEETGATNNQKSYKIVPGATDSKDPTVTVLKSSEKCYVYAKVTNNLVLNGKTVATLNVDSTKWVTVGTSSDGKTTLYRYYQPVDATDADKDVKLDAVFTTVTYADSITKSNISDLKDQTIVVVAYAHQSENTTQTVADAAANTWAGTTAVTA